MSTCTEWLTSDKIALRCMKIQVLGEFELDQSEYVQFNTIQYGTVRYSMVRCSEVCTILTVKIYSGCK